MFLCRIHCLSLRCQALLCDCFCAVSTVCRSFARLCCVNVSVHNSLSFAPLLGSVLWMFLYRMRSLASLLGSSRRGKNMSATLRVFRANHYLWRCDWLKNCGYIGSLEPSLCLVSFLSLSKVAEYSARPACTSLSCCSIHTGMHCSTHIRLYTHTPTHAHTHQRTHPYPMYSLLYIFTRKK